MDINRLEEFLVLSECLNYSKAANMLYLTQPVLSRHINDLEESLGVKLFVRDTHKVSLTPIGEIAAQEIKTVLDSYSTALKNIKSATDSANSSLTLGFLGHAVKGFITQFLEKFETIHPAINITFYASDLDSLINDVLNDRLDLAFTTHITPDKYAELEVEHITDEKLCVVLPENHRLYNNDSVNMIDLDNEPLISFSDESNPYTADFHRSLFEKFGVHMNNVKYINNIDSGFFHVSIGNGSFLIPRHLSFLAGAMKVIPINDFEARIPLNLIWKKSNSKTAITTFVKDFKKFYNDEF